jgi:hypothetical protein
MTTDSCDPCRLNGLRRLSCLTGDEAAFVEAAFARILGSDCPEHGAAYVDLKLHDANADVDARKAAYRASIVAVQDRAVQLHGRRFQHLRGDEQDTLLALLEAQADAAGTGRHHLLPAMLVTDAVEAYFSRPAELGSRPVGVEP